MRNSGEGKVVEGAASGDVEGERRVGGFIGWHNSDASIARSYSTGAVDGNEDAGGFAGQA